jgi:hypothetical protein
MELNAKTIAIVAGSVAAIAAGIGVWCHVKGKDLENQYNVVKNGLTKVQQSLENKK